MASKSFATWWVEERGRPPVREEMALFEMCQAVWESRQNIEDVDDDGCRDLLRKAWRDASELTIELDEQPGQWPGQQPRSLAAQFQRDYKEVAEETMRLDLRVSVVHTPANINLIASSESRLRTVRDTARLLGEWVQQRVLAISGERLCSVVVGAKQTVLAEEEVDA